MQITGLLIAKKTAVRQQWIDLIVETYPPESHNFFKKNNEFQNPVGKALTDLADSVIETVIDDEEITDSAVILEEFVKMRAVQEFSPSEAIGFILFLKQALREQLAEEIASQKLEQELQILNMRIDSILLKVFDIYTQSREKLFKIRADELKRRSYLAFRMNDSNIDQTITDS